MNSEKIEVTEEGIVSHRRRIIKCTITKSEPVKQKQPLNAPFQMAVTEEGIVRELVKPEQRENA
jgi:hypothetical protein